MNREIKFRAVIKHENGIDTLHFNFLDLIGNNCKSLLLIPWLKAGNQPDTFTGLLDTARKEIYEGDIVEFKGASTDTGEIIFMYTPFIGWGHKNRKGEFFLVDPLKYDVQITVLGNIHENPELLEGEEC